MAPQAACVEYNISNKMSKFCLSLLICTTQNCTSPSVSAISPAVCRLHFEYLKKYTVTTLNLIAFPIVCVAQCGETLITSVCITEVRGIFIE